MNAKNVVAWFLAVVLAAMFVQSAVPKLTQDAGMVERFADWGYSSGFLLLVGALEALGAVLLLVPRLATWGAAILVVVMLGAAYTHVSSGIGSPAFALIFAAFAALIAWLRKDQALGLARGS